MLTWHDGFENSKRVRNTEFTWVKLKELCNKLKLVGYNCSSELFDFSPEKIFQDSTHIPYPLTVYKRSEKLNIIIKKYKDYDYIMVFDCDAFFLNEDFEILITDVFEKLKESTIITFDMAKLNEEDSIKAIADGTIDKNTTDWWYAYSGKKEKGPLADGNNGGLGCIFVAPTKLLLDLNGFDETYTTWGGEDGEFLGRIYNSKLPFEHYPIRSFYPIHLNHYY